MAVQIATRETNITWPEDELGCPLRVDYHGASDPQFIRSEVADGPARYRRIKNSERREIRVSFMWTQEQLDAFERFHTTTLQAGMRWFMMSQLTGRGIQPMYCHLMPEPWEFSPQRDRFDRTLVSFVVEAYHSAASAPLPGLSNVPIDAGSATQPADPINGVDNGWPSLPLPTDYIDSLTPGLVY